LAQAILAQGTRSKPMCGASALAVGEGCGAMDAFGGPEECVQSVASAWRQAPERGRTCWRDSGEDDTVSQQRLVVKNTFLEALDYNRTDERWHRRALSSLASSEVSHTERSHIASDENHAHWWLPSLTSSEEEPCGGVRRGSWRTSPPAPCDFPQPALWELATPVDDVAWSADPAPAPDPAAAAAAFGGGSRRPPPPRAPPALGAGLVLPEEQSMPRLRQSQLGWQKRLASPSSALSPAASAGIAATHCVGGDERGCADTDATASPRLPSAVPPWVAAAASESSLRAADPEPPQRCRNDSYPREPDTEPRQQDGATPVVASLALVEVPVDPETVSPTSVGSLLHKDGRCTPCMYKARGMCKYGARCEFCHFSHAQMNWRRPRPPKHVRCRLGKMARSGQSETPLAVQDAAVLQ